MKCPLIMTGVEAFAVVPRPVDGDCLKEGCAWWDDGHPGCSILTIAQELATKRQKEEIDQ